MSYLLTSIIENEKKINYFIENEAKINYFILPLFAIKRKTVT
jgi:hypothetical protein